MVDGYINRDLWLRHEWIGFIFKYLDNEEKQRLTDHIINKYNCIDYKWLLSYYGNSYEQACLAFSSNQGSEYDLKEEFVKENHKNYLEISAILLRKYGYSSVYDVLKLPEEERRSLLTRLSISTHATRRQLFKYLRLSDDK